MSIEPEFLPPHPLSPASAEPPWQPPIARLPFAKQPRRIPNVGHTILFVIVAFGILFVTEIATFAVAMGLHLFGRETAQQLLKEPRLLIPSMAVSYLVAGTIIWAIFTNLWRQSFALAIRWNAGVVRRRFLVLLPIGIALSVTVQLLSNYLPIPKTLPIDDFFRTRADIWLVAVFGTLVAPIFEELAFRGFLLPSLATAWDWAAHRKNTGSKIEAAPAPGALGEAAPSAEKWQKVTHDPSWSTGALVFSSILTSIAFALVHADQLAHSWAPLAVLFTVSIVLCLVRLRTHSLAASSFIHATYNGTIFVLIFFATDGFRHLDKLNR